MDKAKLYQNTEIEELTTVDGKWVLNFSIEGATFTEKADGVKDKLSLYFKMHRMVPDSKYGYELIGKEIVDEFKKDMGVEDISELVGRAVMGIVEKKDKKLEGLVAYKIK